MADNAGEASPLRGENASEGLLCRQTPESCAEFTASKRAIFFVTFVLWAVFGAVLCASMKLGVVETLYVLSQIVTTVGYGDLVPESQGQKLAASFLMLASTLIVANVIMLAVDALLDAEAAKLEKAMEHKEKEIHHMLARENMISDNMEGRDHGIEGEADPEQPPASRRSKKLLTDTRSHALMHAGRSHHEIQQRHKWNRLASDALIFVCVIIAGTLFFGLAEACTCSYDDSEIAGCKQNSCKTTGGYVKTWIDAWYMSVTTVTTVGFGDLTAVTWWGRLFASIWMLIGTGAMVNFISSLSEAIYNYQSKRENYRQMKKMFVEHDVDHDGLLDEREFLKLQFVQLGLVTAEQFDSIVKQFQLIAGDDNKVSKEEYASFYLHDEAKVKGSDRVFDSEEDVLVGEAVVETRAPDDEEAGGSAADRAANDAAESAKEAD